MRMIYRFLFVIFFSAIGINSFSQIDNLDRLMTRRQLTCWDIEYNCSILIPKFYNNGKLDSVHLLLNYWKKKCGQSEIISHTKLLLSIDNGTFNDKDINAKLFNQLISYNQQKEYNKLDRQYYMNQRYYNLGYDSLYNVFLKTLAKNQKNKPLKPTEEFVINLYSDTSIVHISDIINNQKYNDSQLLPKYRKFKDSVLHIPSGNFAFYTGYFNPLGNNQLFGNKMIVGFTLGTKIYKNSFDLLLDFKTGKSKEKYSVMYMDSLTLTDKFMGLYIGTEYSRTILQTKKTEFLGSIGFGGERITSISADEKNDKKAKFLWSPNLNAGFGLRYSYNNNAYLGIYAGYNYLNFNNKGGTDISGHAFSIRLILGILSNYEQDNLYNYLD